MACDAFNARTDSYGGRIARLYVVARKLPRLLPGAVVVARLFPVGEKCHGVPAVWLGTVGKYPLYPLCCAAVILRAFFFKVLRLVGL